MTNKERAKKIVDEFVTRTHARQSLTHKMLKKLIERELDEATKPVPNTQTPVEMF